MAGLFGGSDPPPQPIIQPPPPMPDKESPAVREAQRKAAAEAMGRAGRASTILTDVAGTGTAPAANQGNTDTYSSKKLGGQ